ncbi:tissue inhibitor of metalloproteinase [Phlebotomus argentipes]|uniref:tissue inhibitor of metalloproteinase n=1 Tax=Phlebotomus argentipes TaxID=94469 RepID=UPI0028931EA2|nr:tissue inhibitor of metalloproteinase [Phlebotomus argentipes]
MDTKRTVIFCIIAFIGLAMISTPADACSCALEHTQTKICNSEFAIIARVLKRSIPHANGPVVYKLHIYKTYKMNGKEPNKLKMRRILTTPPMSSMCGVDLKPGLTYAIAGRGTQINLCSYVKEYKKMTVVERRGFASSYHKGCSCRIQPCFSNDCPPAEKTCSWSYLSACESDYGVCIPTRGSLTPDGEPTKCHWKRSSPYMSCILAP